MTATGTSPAAPTPSPSHELAGWPARLDEAASGVSITARRPPASAPARPRSAAGRSAPPPRPPAGSACSAITKSSPGGSAIATRRTPRSDPPPRHRGIAELGVGEASLGALDRDPVGRSAAAAWIQDITTDTVVSPRVQTTWQSRRRVRGHPLRDRRRRRRRHRQDHDQPARGAQRVPARDRGRAVRRVHASARGPRRRRDHPHRRGPGRVLLGRRPARARLSAAATSPAPTRPPAGRHEAVGRFEVTDLHVQIRRLPKPVVAMVAGYAVGGGHVLHVVCDLTIAADNARFGQTGPKVGSFDGGFGATVLSRLVGPKKAKEIWFLCRQYDAQEALADGAGQHGRAARAARGRRPSSGAARCSRCPRSRCGCSRRASTPTRTAWPGIQQLAHDANLLFYMSEEAQEGRNAYLEKRKPDFSKFPRRA